MKTPAPTAAPARRTTQDVAPATPLRLSMLRAFATTSDAEGSNDPHPSRKRELRGRYLAASSLLIPFRVRR